MQVAGEATVGQSGSGFRAPAAKGVVAVGAAWEEGPTETRVAGARASFAAMQPYTMSGVYVNFIVGQQAEAVRDSYGANYDRLAALKCQYDPTNFFRANQNIQPTLNQP